MKDLKSKLIRLFAVSTGITLTVLLFLALPVLETLRATVANAIGFTPQGIWFLGIALVAIGQMGVLIAAIRKVSAPIQRLASEAERGSTGFAFQSRSASREEDRLKHWVESTNLRAQEATDQAEQLEKEFKLCSSSLADTQRELEKSQAALEKAESQSLELRTKNEALLAAKTALEETLAEERQRKVGVEVEKRTEEIYSQMEKAISAAAFKSLWIPSIVHELKAPIAEIQSLTKELTKDWEETSITRMKTGIEKIHALSEKQITLLESALEKNVEPMPRASEKPQVLPENSAESEVEVIAPTETLDSEELQVLEEEIEQNEIELEEARNPLEMGILADQQEPASAPSSNNSLDKQLFEIIQKHSHFAPQAHLSFDIQEGLEAEIEDENILLLLDTLVDAATHKVEDGDIVLSVELQENGVLFAVSCDGRLSKRTPLSLEAAQRLAQNLKIDLDTDQQGAGELYLTFEYPFNQDGSSSAEPADTIIVE